MTHYHVFLGIWTLWFVVHYYVYALLTLAHPILPILPYSTLHALYIQLFEFTLLDQSFKPMWQDEMVV